jgi:hypothetical protein
MIAIRLNGLNNIKEYLPLITDKTKYQRRTALFAIRNFNPIP